HARAQQTPAPQTGRSYETGPPARKPASPAPQSQSPVNFTDVTARSGVNFRHAASPTSQKYLPETMGGGAALFDYDNDGRLDLFVARYMDWDFERGALYCGSPQVRAYCHPDNFKGSAPLLFHQKPDGTFEEVSERAGVADSSGKSLGVAFADFDNDGLTDVFVANDNARQF